MRLRYTIPLVATALVLGIASVNADTGFVTTLDACNEVVTGGNPNPCGVSTATGNGVFVLNTAGTALTFNITFSGLTSTQTAAHFHNAAAGVNGGVVRGFTLGSPIIGTWLNTDAQSLTPALATAVVNGGIYVNVHSQNYPAGEVRGQVVPESVPTRADTWGRVKRLYR